MVANFCGCDMQKQPGVRTFGVESTVVWSLGFMFSVLFVCLSAW